ncbi:MAG: imidazole glycerol phosphate synthase subunit HisH [Deltaproteobacteria bacterium]|nr:MAG: imidazole glycerol phosphate synthase subunit HisH [Deltaproteobacteria bacterium]
MLLIVDYGLGNVNSVANMIRYLGGTCDISSDPARIMDAEGLILPGVGAFDAGMDALNKQGLIDVLSAVVLKKKIPILGICLGMQIMTRASEEGRLSGLGWIEGEVRRFAFEGSKLKIPHMGWNIIEISRQNRLIEAKERQRFYFVHSYYVCCNNQADIVATCHYGHNFVAAFAKKNIFGVQFHPEKSHRFGMSVLKRFMEFLHA